MILTRPLLLGTLILTSMSAWADEQGNTPFTPLVPQEGQTANPNSTLAFAGIDMGSSALATVPSSESKKDGYQLDVKGLISFYHPSWDFDLGLGYFSNNMSTTVHNLRVVTNGVLLDFEPQYRCTSRWQLGIALNLLVGSDVSFSESDTGSNSDTFNLLAGVVTKYEIPVGKIYSLRLAAQVLSTITETSRLIWIAQGGLQFGFPI